MGTLVYTHPHLRTCTFLVGAPHEDTSQCSCPFRKKSNDLIVMPHACVTEFGNTISPVPCTHQARMIPTSQGMGVAELLCVTFQVSTACHNSRLQNVQERSYIIFQASPLVIMQGTNVATPPMYYATLCNRIGTCCNSNATSHIDVTSCITLLEYWKHPITLLY